MRKIVVSFFSLLALLASAGAASADVGQGQSAGKIPAFAKQQIRSQVVADAKAFLKTRGYNLNRPSYRLEYSRTATGGIKVEAGIWQKGGGFVPLPNRRTRAFQGSFVAQPEGRDSYMVRSAQKWSPIYYLTGGAAAAK